MLQFTLESITTLVFNFLFYFIIGSFGAFLKDLHETLTKKNEQIRLSEVLIGGACATFICLAIRDLSWFADASIGFMAMTTFILGIVGFEIFGNLTTLNKLKVFISKIQKFRNMPPEEWDQDSADFNTERDESKSSTDSDISEQVQDDSQPEAKKTKKRNKSEIP